LLSLPRLYAILDVDTVTARGLEPLAVADCWINAGVRLIQLRAKNLASGEFLSLAKDLVKLIRKHNAENTEDRGDAEILILINDRADIALMSGADGVHVGQDDLQPKDLRASAALRELRVVGVSTHNLDQLRAAVDQPADYFAIGPVFTTSSKLNPDPVVGLQGVSAARALLDARGDRRPLVAIGGVTPDNAPDVFRAGADSVAMISALFTYRITSFLPEAFYKGE
jgi:thiamine-phosphate pyrophosphorylase